jgi:branched-chain amino acid aminotransferase
VIGLLRDNGVSVIEKTLAYRDFESADEIFSTGNYSKVVPVTKIGDRALPFGPIYSRARELYWDFAHSRDAIATGLR